MFDEKFSKPTFLCLTCEHQEICRISDAYQSLFDKVSVLIEQPNTFNIQIQCQFYAKNKPTQRSYSGYPVTVNDGKKHQEFH